MRLAPQSARATSARNPERGWRRGAHDLFSLPSLPFEWLAAWVLLHYGSLFRGSESLTGPFQTAVSGMIPYQMWGGLAEAVGASMIVLTFGTLWMQWEVRRVRQFACVCGMLLMGFLAYSCWKTDVPFDVSRIFSYYAGIHLFAGILIHQDRKAVSRACPSGRIARVGEV